MHAVEDKAIEQWPTKKTWNISSIENLSQGSIREAEPIGE